MRKRKIKAATRHARAKKIGLALMGGYDKQLAKQGGGCAICGQPPLTRRLHVDHDHVTGTVRGLLCWTCNATIGRAKDDAERLTNAGVYLRWGWFVATTHREVKRRYDIRVAMRASDRGTHEDRPD